MSTSNSSTIVVSTSHCDSNRLLLFDTIDTTLIDGGDGSGGRLRGGSCMLGHGVCCLVEVCLQQRRGGQLGRDMVHGGVVGEERSP